jgi:tRNA G10  N-methylase Trm11
MTIQKTLISETFHDNEIYSNLDIASFGTFRDSKSAPIHRWFQYPAGFSYKAVEYALKLNHVSKNNVVYDPFAGTGTTNVTCKSKGIQSFGVEAHPFVSKIAQTKLKWNYDYEELNRFTYEFINLVNNEKDAYKKIKIDSVPELLRKCYSDENLQKLLFLRCFIETHVPKEFVDLFNIALVGSLRIASGAATGWPYIAPNKKIQEKDGIETFTNQIILCIRDLRSTPEKYRDIQSEVINGDCRSTNFPDEHFDFVFTSPPYLNNYDYADRTRLETYFMGFADSWGDITEKVRDKLIISATTQISRAKYNINDIISNELKDANIKVAKEIQSKVTKLSEIRNTKGGKKSYDIMVGGYFNDLTSSLIDTYRTMKKGSHYQLVLGDSAPYGIHIPTETYIGEIGLGIGFKEYSVLELRKRGGKWKDNPQRHSVPLRESILTFKK